MFHQSALCSCFQFKQLLMIGGCDRYMQIAKCFRDEGGKIDRQPEFTQVTIIPIPPDPPSESHFQCIICLCQVDLEMSFVTQDHIKNLVEQLLKYCWPKSLPPLKIPFTRMTYGDCMKRYGSDKPDTRFKMKVSCVLKHMPSSTVCTGLQTGFQVLASWTKIAHSSLPAVGRRKWMAREQMELLLSIMHYDS